MTCQISVIIPVLNEAHIINQAVAHLFSQRSGENFEVLVVDGSPRHTTLKAIRDERVIKVASEKGRGIQMNAGAGRAKGEVLLFLHADTLLPPDGLDQIAGVMRQDHIAGGAFDLGIGSARPVFRVIEKTASLRSRITRIPYGDQAIFLKKKIFYDMGGFETIPLMEDVEIMYRLRQARKRIVILPAKAVTSPRRWEREGVCYGTLRNWLLVTLYLIGGNPEKLVRFYRQ